MASTIGIHGQVQASTSEDVLFTCPYDQFVASTLFVCNTNGGAATTFSIYVAPDRDGTQAQVRHALYSVAPIAVNTTVPVTAGITLSYGYRIIVQGGTGFVVFNLFGEGIDLEDDE